MSQMCWKNYFAQPIMKVIGLGKRKPFKTNNSSEIQYGLHISNAPITGGGGSSVARVPCTLGQEIFLSPYQQKLQSLKWKIAAKILKT